MPRKFFLTFQCASCCYLPGHTDTDIFMNGPLYCPVVTGRGQLTRSGKSVRRMWCQAFLCFSVAPRAASCALKSSLPSSGLICPWLTFLWLTSLWPITIGCWLLPFSLQGSVVVIFMLSSIVYLFILSLVWTVIDANSSWNRFIYLHILAIEVSLCWIWEQFLEYDTVMLFPV